MASKRKRVPSFTNDVGFYALPSSSNWVRDYYTAWGGGTHFLADEPSSSNIAFSLKSVTLSGGINRIPTEYVRKVSRITSMGKVDFVSGVPGNSYTFTGDSSIHPRGVTLSASPFGDRVDSYAVNVPPDIIRQSIVEAKNKIVNLNVGLIEDLVQARQTVSLMKDIYELLIALYHIIRAQDFRYLQRRLNGAGFNIPQKLGNAWLAWNYGVKPVLNTFMALYDTLQNGKPRISEVKRTVNYALDPKDAFGANDNDLSCSGRAIASSRCTFVVDYVGGVLQQLSEDVIGYSNIPATLWALAPYSFVIDWLIPVENWLKSVTFAKGLSVKQSYCNINIYANCVAVARNPGVYPYDSVGSLPIAKVEIAHTSRVIVNPYVPGLPYVQASLTPTRILSATALLTTRR